MLIGAALGWALWAAYPDTLDVQTDIIGYPTFAGFDARRWIYGYGLLVVVVPVLAIGAWALLGRLRALRARPPGSHQAPVRPRADREDGSGLGAVIARLAAVGFVWGVAFAVALDPGDGWVAWLLVPTIVVYVAAVALGALAVSRRARRPWRALVALANSVAASLLLLAVALASGAIEVLVVSTGERVAYPLLPAAILIVIALIVAALIIRALRAGEPRDWIRIERRTIAYLTAPVALFLLLAAVPGDLPAPDLFHEGERLASMNLVSGGRFPWRDIVSAHGLLEDLGWPSLGTAIFGDSRWGWFAGRAVIETPAFWITTLLLCAYLFRRNLLFLAGIVALVVLGWVPGIGDFMLGGPPLGTQRLVAVPLIWLLLAAVLSRPSWVRVVGFMAISLASAIAVPETLLFSGAAWLAVIAYELIERAPAAPLARSLARTRRCAIAGGVMLAAFAAYLAAEGALGDFVGFFIEFTSGHYLTGALPINWQSGGHPASFAFWVFAPLVTILAAWWYVAWRVRRRARLSVPEWVIGAAVLALIPYYLRFLSRADTHLFLVASVAFVPVAYIVYRVLEALEVRATAVTRGRLGAHPLTLVLLLAVLVLAPVSALTTLEDAPGRFSVAATEPPPFERAGYSPRSSLDPALVGQVREVIDRYLAPGEKLFDFTNSPELFGYFIDLDTATRYYQVSLAIRESTQEDLIDELAAEKPGLVVYSSQRLGLPIWDGISNPVRHYLVSDWLLDNYRPVAEVQGYVFMVPADATTGGPAEEQLLAAGQPCDWGLAPNFLEVEHGPEGAPAGVPIRPARPAVSARGWAADASGRRPAGTVLLAVGERVVATVPTGGARPDVAASL
ncbi:MAG: hypothetical protein GEU88_12205, partial [Solirubrobacterales bacterium]|nr:hypothetical protein [Solirubrobacterales bacterium]